MNNNILKIQNDLFFLSQKKNISENRHEKWRELPDYYLKSRAVDTLVLSYDAMGRREGCLMRPENTTMGKIIIDPVLSESTFSNINDVKAHRPACLPKQPI